jgi:outer membrane immunogenic protein
MKRLVPGVVALRMVIFVCAAIMAVATARAADLPAPAASSYYPPSFAPAIYNWTGIYFGGQIGGGLLTDGVTQSAAGALALTGSSNLSAGGVVGGGQIGANYQFSSWVVGIEGAWSATSISGSDKASTTTALTQLRVTSAPAWFAAATARLGYAANSWLFYAKGGGAWMQVNYTEDVLLNGVTTATQNLNDTRSGFTAGVGVEYGLTESFSARLEYNFYDFGSKAYNFSPATFTPVSIRSDLSALTFGVNYRFGWH